MSAYIPTAVCLITLVAIFIASLIKKDYKTFLTWSVIMTGMVYFPLIMGFHFSDGTYLIAGTRNPATFYIYTFIVPPSYGISVEKKKDLVMPILNLVLLEIVIINRLDLNYGLIYMVIYAYVLLVTSFFSMTIQKYYNQILLENTRITKMAMRDELTRLYNRHHLQDYEDTEQEWIPIMLDIDKFKLVNDEYGHDEGDRVLQQLAAIMLRYANDNFIPFRYGGEEFLFLSKMSEESTDKHIIDFFEAVRRELHTSDRKPKTVSIGIGRKGVLNEGSIKRADINLYICKNNGRNCISKNNEVFYS
ncbi:GGDEF domain-containing protein [uncultured Streptococcus sp.]|uniref:GGDEF domain-containing protein n=1 Tax=uncultured Streptococcus sp. TaxID=83427 RepID=UPI00259446A3|nr:GGDEF domain-containing protein [uncultured Streptococcus sp.]